MGRVIFAGWFFVVVTLGFVCAGLSAPVTSGTGVQQVTETERELTRRKKLEEQEKARKEAEQKVLQAKRQEIDKKIREKLIAQEWKVYLIPTGSLAAKMPIQADTLAFTGMTITSQFMVKNGFSGSNYALTAREDGSAYWETMQRSGEGDLAFWRGDLSVQSEGMGGVLGIETKKGETEEYSFTTTKPEGFVEPKEKPKPAEEVAAPQESAPEAKTVTPAAPQKEDTAQKKKKGL